MTCAHNPCTCAVGKDGDHCGPTCRTGIGDPGEQCKCGHADCAASTGAA